jgi:hypothetical protein
MTPLPKRIFIAFVAGLTFSALLLVLEGRTVAGLRYIWGMLQIPGFIVGASIWGVHSGGNGFLAVMVLVNGFVYGFLLFVIWGLLRLARNRDIASDPPTTTPSELGHVPPRTPIF